MSDLTSLTWNDLSSFSPLPLSHSPLIPQMAAKIVLAGERAAERTARREAAAVLRALESVEGSASGVEGAGENYKMF